MGVSGAAGACCQRPNGCGSTQCWLMGGGGRRNRTWLRDARLEFSFSTRSSVFHLMAALLRSRSYCCSNCRGAETQEERGGTRWRTLLALSAPVPNDETASQPATQPATALPATNSHDETRFQAPMASRETGERCAVIGRVLWQSRGLAEGWQSRGQLELPSRLLLRDVSLIYGKPLADIFTALG